VTLSGVRVKGGTSDASAGEKVFAFVTFKTSDIEDLNVLENSDAAAAVSSAAPDPAPAHHAQAPQQQQQQQQQIDRRDAQSGNRGGRGGRQGGGRTNGPAWHEQPHPNPNPLRQPQPQPQQSPVSRRAPRNGQFNVSADAGQIEALKSQLGEFNFEESNSKFAEVAAPAAAPAAVDVKPVYVKDDFFDCLSAPTKSEERGRNSQQRQVDIDTFGEEALANRPRGAPRRGGGGNGRRGGGRGGQRQQHQ
jgi:ribosomal protein L12E/L44/L45/RPP1/RPP2